MGLEAATYIMNMTPINPVSTDTKSQGDDHLRLIKQVLQNTFPNATGPYYFPTTALNDPTSIPATARNKVLIYSSASEITLTLPPVTAPTLPTGWYVDIVKAGMTTNGFTVVSSGAPGPNIVSTYGSMPSIRVGIPIQPVRFMWNGANWYCFKQGAPVGAMFNYDNITTVPPGYLGLSTTGQNVSAVVYPELAGALGYTPGSGTFLLPNVSGRVFVGAGVGTGLDAVTVEQEFGLEDVLLAPANIPSLTSSGNNNISVSSPTLAQHPSTITTDGASGSYGQIFPNTRTLAPIVSTNAAQAISVGYTNASPTRVDVRQPSRGVLRIIRAC